MVTLLPFLLLMETLHASHSVRQRIATIEFRSDGITIIRLDDNAEVKLQDSLAQHRLLKENYDGIKKYRLLIKPGKYSSITQEAREFASTPDANHMTLGTAVIIRSLAQRIVINFMINFIQKQNMKMRMFESEEKALEWLKELKE